MKLQRPGYTETDLMFCKYLNEIGIVDPIVSKTEDNFLLWLYKTAGWYDMDIPCRGIDFPKGCDIDKNELVTKIKTSDSYRLWTTSYHESIKNSDFLIPLCHRLNFEKYYENYFQHFIYSLSSKNNINNQFDNFWCRYHVIYDLIKNSNVLVISSFADLIAYQFHSKNIYKIYNNFPRLKKLIPYTFPYTFFNTGPDKNSFETLNRIFQDIISLDFDILLVAAGAYGCLLVDMVDKEGKTGITMGSNLSDFFGINPRKTDPYWINNIPKEYIPKGYKAIDRGKYWINTDVK